MTYYLQRQDKNTSKNMQQIRINRQNLSKLFFEVIFQRSEDFLHGGWGGLREDLRKLDDLRGQADYNTGSINPSAAFVLYAICEYLQPTTIAEVGTFIGKSTLAMARAIESQPNAVIHTCDFSNSIELSLPTKTRVVQYKRKSSTQMFEALINSKVRVDILALDGRINSNDLTLLSDIVLDRTVIILDDFEGVEKGVANANLLFSSSLFKNYLLIYPASFEALGQLGFISGCTTALMIPASLFAYCSQ
jgi:hypothetical protein